MYDEKLDVGLKTESRVVLFVGDIGWAASEQVEVVLAIG